MNEKPIDVYSRIGNRDRQIETYSNVSLIVTTLFCCLFMALVSYVIIFNR